MTDKGKLVKILEQPQIGLASEDIFNITLTIQDIQKDKHI